MTFLKWVGGKTQLLSDLSELFPDINNIKGYIEPFCVCKDSVLLLNQQDKIKIQDIEFRKEKQIDLFGKSIYTDSVMVLDLNRNKEDVRDILIKTECIIDLFSKGSQDIDVYNISTRNGRSLNATGDHTFLIKDNKNLLWKQLKEIKFGDMVAVFPSVIPLSNKVDIDEIILERKKLIENIDENIYEDKLLTELENAGLLPLTNKNPKLHILARIIGFLITDGSAYEYERLEGKRKGEKGFHIRFTGGNKLYSLAKDIELLGFKVGVVKEKERRSEKEKHFGKCYEMELYSKSFFILLKTLGIPIGKRTDQIFHLPNWIYKCSMRVKQEFLAGIMGGDGTTVNFRYKNFKGIYDKRKNSKDRLIADIIGPGITQSKLVEFESYLKEYLEEICILLKEFAIEYRLQYINNYRRDDGKELVKYRIDFLDNHKNILKFLRYIGYRYDNQKIETSYPIYEYLLSKEKRSGINNSVRKSFQIFPKWKETYVLDNIVFDEVIKVKKIKYDDKLYDLSIENIHNYIINEFVVHNCGGASVFFYLMENFYDSLSKKKVYLSDINAELINCYKVVRDDLDLLLPLLEKHQEKHCEQYYYDIRDSYHLLDDSKERAAAFIYLNKTGFNGLWRVNKSGKPNMPIGHKEKIEIYNNGIIRSSSLLQGINLNVISFENILRINKGELKDWYIFLDPPYYDIGQNNFTGYTADDFHLTKRLALPKVFKELDKLGCKVMLSNSNSPLIEKEFKGYNIKILKAKRMINSDGKNRGYVNEVVVMNYQKNKRQKTIEDVW